MRLGYAPIDRSLQAPGDRRRFVAWARDRNVEFEIVDEPRPDLDVVVVAMPADIARWRNAPATTKIVYDVTDDYLVLADDGFKNRARGVAKFLSGEISRPTLAFRELFADMCRRADIVVATSERQRQHVAAVTGRDNTRVIIDSYDDTAAAGKRDYRRLGEPRIGWEGLPFNIATLSIVGEAVRGLPPELAPSLHVVTPPVFRPYARRFGRRAARRIARQALPGVPLFMYDWHQATVGGVIASCDVAVIPLPAGNPFAMSKSAQKLISMWSLGMPTVTTATQAYDEAMAAAGLALTCATTEDWRRVLSELFSDESARREAGEKGRAYVQATLNREAIFARWDEVLATVAPSR